MKARAFANNGMAVLAWVYDTRLAGRMGKAALAVHRLVTDRGLSQIGSDQMRVKSENPLVPRCKFGALTNSRRHHGTLLDAALTTLSVSEINELV
jgi:hypothetical protein